MAMTNGERRSFLRHAVCCGMVFSDNDHLIGMSKVVDLSRCGVRCVSLTPVDCVTCTLENIELFGSDDDLFLTDVGGKMTRCSTEIANHDAHSSTGYYEFAFEFFPQHYDKIARLEKLIVSRR